MVDGCGVFKSSSFKASNNPEVAALPALSSPSINVTVDAYSLNPKLLLVPFVVPPLTVKVKLFP